MKRFRKQCARVRKRGICILLAAALLLCGVPAAGGATAVNGVILLAVNDSIPGTLSADTMPFYSGGTLYVPWTLFNNTALGVTPSYNVLGGTLTLFNINSRIVFDLEAGTSTDSKNTGASWSTITKSGLVFVPASYCASYFGLGISYLTSSGGYSVVRFTTGDQVYDDAYFLEKADSLIETRVAQYFSSALTESPAQSGSSSGSSASSGSSSASSGSTSSAGSSTETQTAQESTATDTAGTQTTQTEETAEEEAPEETEEETEEEEAEEEAPEEAESPADAYLLYYNAAGMEALAEELEAQGLTGAFFLTPAELEAYPALMARLLAGGHSVGLLLEEDGSAEDLEAANDLADMQTRLRLLWVYARADADAAADLGYVVLTPDSGNETAELLELDSTEALQTLEDLQEAGRTVCTLRLTSFQG